MDKETRIALADVLNRLSDIGTELEAIAGRASIQSIADGRRELNRAVEIVDGVVCSLDEL